MIDEGDPARVCFQVDWRLYWYRSNITMGKLPQPPRSFEEHVENLMGVDLAKSQLPLTTEKKHIKCKNLYLCHGICTDLLADGTSFSHNLPILNSGFEHGRSVGVAHSHYWGPLEIPLISDRFLVLSCPRPRCHMLLR